MRALLFLIFIVVVINAYSTPIIMNFSGGGAAAMSFQLGVLKQLETKGELDISTISRAYCVSGGCGTGILVQRLGIDGAIEFMKKIRKDRDAMKRHLFLSTFVFDLYDGLYYFDPLKEKIKRAIQGKPKRFPLTILTTDFDQMKTLYIDTENLSDNDLVDWMGAAKAIPGLVESYKGKYADAAITSPFATDPVFERPDFPEIKMYVLNAHLYQMPPRKEKTAAENLSRVITWMIADKNIKAIGKIKRKMTEAGNPNLHVYSMKKLISTVDYTRENIQAGIRHGLEVEEIPQDEVSTESFYLGGE